MTVSDSTKKDLTAWDIVEDNITVIHNGINKINVKSNKEKKKTAMFLGAIAKDKGIEDALKIFAEINKEKNGWQFWVVGQSSDLYLQYLKNEAKKLNIRNLKFWG